MDARVRRGLAGFLSPVALLFLTCFALSPRAAAQYMYLDTNGDGVHTKADVVNPRDTTRIGVWLVTDHNRDGSTVPCTLGGLTYYQHWSVVLRVTNGALGWGDFAFTEPQENLTAVARDSIEYVVYGEAPAPFSGGKFRLGTLSVAVLHGTPALGIAAVSTKNEHAVTGFTSACTSRDLYNVRILGEDWKDVDTLAYGGRANTPPVLTAAAEMPIRAGTSATYRIEAVDKDGDPVTFRTAVREGAAPPRVRVRTVDAGHGRALGEVTVTADSCDENGWYYFIEASDGIWSDRKEVLSAVERVPRPVPANPMGPSREKNRAPKARPTKVSGPESLVGEWEWARSLWGGPSGGLYFGGNMFLVGAGPRSSDTRRRLVFAADGSYERYDISSGKVRMSEKGTYRFGVEREQRYLELTGSGTFSTWSVSPDTLGFIPFMSHDAGAEYYVRVPSIPRHGARLDTLRLAEPLGHPRISGSGEVMLSASMRNALRLYDREFHPYTVRDWPGPSNYEYSETQIPWALIGDFDGDLIADAALYGRSGTDEVVVAILSGHGNVRAVEVTRRPATKEGEHPFLELIARGAQYSPCWARKGSPETDAIGIVSPGVARFDYGLLNGEFVVYAPVP